MVLLKYPGPITPTVAAAKAAASPPPSSVMALVVNISRCRTDTAMPSQSASMTNYPQGYQDFGGSIFNDLTTLAPLLSVVQHRWMWKPFIPLLVVINKVQLYRMPSRPRYLHSMATDVNAPARSTMPAPSSFIDYAEMASRLIFGFDLRPIQRHVLSQIFNPANLRKRLIVQPTAIGKSHIIRMMGVLFKGIHLILHPLLALTGDQVLAFREGVDDYGCIEAHNLDQQASSSSAVLQCIIKRMREMTSTTTTTMFLFASPQFLSNHPSFLKAIMECNNKHTFRSLSVDECHLFAQHGSSFRAEIRSLTRSFFSPIWGGNTNHPHFLALTATLSSSDLAMLTSITTVHFPPQTHTWATEDGFKQEHIEIKFKVSSEYVKHVDHTVTYLKKNDDSAYIFSNSKKLSFRLLESLEAKLDKGWRARER